MGAQAPSRTSKKWKALVVVLAIGLAFSITVNIANLLEIRGLRSSYNALNQTYVNLRRRYDTLNTTYFSLQFPAVTGIVDLKSEGHGLDDKGLPVTLYTLYLRLVTDDIVNGHKAGEIVDYTVSKDVYDEVCNGDLVKGIPQRKPETVLYVERGSPLQVVQIISGFSSYLVEFEGVTLNVPPGQSYSAYLAFGLKNDGERPIVAVRVKLNGKFIPFGSGVSRSTPLNLGLWTGIGLPIAWFDPDSSGTVGCAIVPGDTYSVEVNITFDDGKLIKRTFTVQAESAGVIATLAPCNIVEIGDISLLRLEDGKGVLSVRFRNTWWNGQELETISNINVSLMGKPVIVTSILLQGGGYWAASSTLSFEVSIVSTYIVTIQVEATDGTIGTISTIIPCEPA